MIDADDITRFYSSVEHVKDLVSQLVPDFPVYSMILRAGSKDFVSFGSSSGDVLLEIYDISQDGVWERFIGCENRMRERHEKLISPEEYKMESGSYVDMFFGFKLGFYLIGRFNKTIDERVAELVSRKVPESWYFDDVPKLLN